jgi:hypothetical protein
LREREDFMWFRTVVDFLGVAWKWVVFVVAAFLLMALLKECDRADRAEAEVERVKEDVALTAKNHTVAHRVNAEILKAALTTPLKAEIARLEKDLGSKPKVVVVERIVTAPSPAEGLPRPKPLPGEPCPQCMFAAGDTGEIRVDSAHVETAAGNEVVALSAECWRLTPEPATRILAGVASAPLSRVSVVAPPKKLGWGAGLAGGYSTSGPVGSVLVVSPPFLGAHLEGVGVLSAGPGVGAIQAGVVYRP